MRAAEGHHGSAQGPGIEINARTKAADPTHLRGVGWDDCVQLLLAAGADRAAKTEKGRTARDATAMKMAKADAETKPRSRRSCGFLMRPEPRLQLTCCRGRTPRPQRPRPKPRRRRPSPTSPTTRLAGPRHPCSPRRSRLPVPGLSTFSGGRLPLLPFGTAATPRLARPPPLLLFGGTHASWRCPFWAIRHGSHAENWHPHCWALRRGGSVRRRLARPPLLGSSARHPRRGRTRRPCCTLWHGGHAEGLRTPPLSSSARHAEGRTRRPCCTLWHGSHAEGWRTGRR